MAVIRILLVALLLPYGSACVARGVEPPQPQSLPQWIGPAQFRVTRWVSEKTFPRASDFAGIQKARLRLAADFCGCVVDLNGQILLRVTPYCPTQELDVTDAVRQGLRTRVFDMTGRQKENEHLLRFTTYQGSGPAAVALTLTIVDNTGTQHLFQTDDAWKHRPNLVKEEPFDITTLGPVRPELWGVGRRDASMSALENYEQWQQSRAAGTEPTQKFYVPEGFEVALLRTAAAEEGSWIALGFDPQGRALVSREDQGFLRFSFDAEHRKIERVEQVASDLKECRGLLYAYDRWYANANNSKGMYRFQIDEAGKIVDQKLLREFPGSVGHGRNDLALGKDGRIYSIHGDSVETPTTNVRDRTSPLDRQKPGAKPNRASVVSTDADGNNWEVLCTGLRNPYGLGVHPSGDLFTYDADNEFDMGTPWYRPTRIVHLRSGADYGYRITTDNRRPNYVDRPDNAQPLIDVGRGSPTACMFGTNLEFPKPYRDALYVLDWTYGRVLAVHMAPRGAGYRANLETFLQGRPLNVTDVTAGPDGAMYLITGGRKTQSALYRVAFTGKEPSYPEDSRHEQDVAEFSKRKRVALAEIEHLHGIVSPFGTKEAAASMALAMRHIYDPDPVIQYAARTLLEQAPREFWSVRALYPLINRAFRPPYAFETAAVRSGNETLSRMVLQEFASAQEIVWDMQLDWIPFFDRRTLLLDLLLRAESQAPDAARAQRGTLLSKWERRWEGDEDDGFSVSPYGDSRWFRRKLASALIDWDDPNDPQMTVAVADRLLTSDVQEDRLAGLSLLSNVRRGWTPETRRLYFTALRDARRFVGGQGMPGFLDQIKTDAVATLSDSEKRELADLLAPPKETDEPLPPMRPIVKKWTLDELAKLTAAGSSDDPRLRGDSTKGAIVFREALCSRCHRAGLSGPAVGPDLTFVAARFSRRDILHSVLEPSAAVAEQYRNTEIVTDDGRTLVGRVVSEGDFRSEKLLINTDPLRPSRVTEVDKKQIAEHRAIATSPMPQGLLDGFTPAEVRDLLAFLEAGP